MIIKAWDIPSVTKDGVQQSEGWDIPTVTKDVFPESAGKGLFGVITVLQITTPPYGLIIDLSIQNVPIGYTYPLIGFKYLDFFRKAQKYYDFLLKNEINKKTI